MFDPYLAAWNLTPGGEPIVTHAARLLPVVQGGEKAMLKVSHEADERAGNAVMAWWNGQGAARVLACEEDAILLERATGRASLADMARSGRDDEASRILCATAARLHAPRNGPAPPELVPLDIWFRELEPMARKHGGILARCAETARMLLGAPRDVVVLHGDLHHDNVLDFGERGWLAIDPKRLIGEQGFDYANIFTNPDLADPKPPVCVIPDVFSRRVAVISEAAGLERRRLLLWILAWCGLSAAWFLGEGDPAEIDFAVAEMAAAELDR